MNIFRSGSISSFEAFKERCGAQLRQTLKGGAPKETGRSTQQLNEPGRPSVRQRPVLIERPGGVDAASALLDVTLTELSRYLPPETLEKLGTRAGRCIVDRLPIGLHTTHRNHELAKFIQGTFWKAVFGKQADQFKRAARTDETTQCFDSYCIDELKFRWRSRRIENVGRGARGADPCARYCCGLIRGALQGVSQNPAHREDGAIAVVCELLINGSTRFWISFPVREPEISCVNGYYIDRTEGERMADEINRLYRLTLNEQNLAAAGRDDNNNDYNTANSSRNNNTIGSSTSYSESSTLSSDTTESGLPHAERNPGIISDFSFSKVMESIS